MAGERAESAEIRVRVQPRSSREGIVGERDGALIVRISAPPVEGKANEALRALIAKRAGVAKRQVGITQGAKGRDKVVRVEGISRADLRRALDLG